MGKNVFNVIREEVDKYLLLNGTPFVEVEYLSPDGKPMPNALYCRKAAYINRCMVNESKFIIPEGVADWQGGMDKYKGGVITFSTDVNCVELSTNAILNKVKQFVTTFNQRFTRKKRIHNVINKLNAGSEEKIEGYSVGNFFEGNYVGKEGEKYSEKSISVFLGGISSQTLLKLAEMLAAEFKQETVLVKDFNTNKIYYANSIPMPSDTTLEGELKRINTEC